MMNRSMKLLPLLVAFVLLCAPAHASTVAENRAYPAFQAGVTGLWVSIEPGRVMTVQRVDPGSPAQGMLEAGDVVVRANGRVIGGEDPRVPLGRALTEAEANGRGLTLGVMRGGREVVANIPVPQLGAYAPGWPINCNKSDQIVAAVAQRLAEAQTEDGWFDERGRGGLTQCLAAMYLLSTGDDAYDEHVRRFAHALAASMNTGMGSSVWHVGYQLIFLGEYYLDTGDLTVLPAMESACRAAAEHQTAGAWGHSFNNVSVGYVQSGLMNSGGVTLFIGLTLARECGITVHEQAYQRSLVFFYRMVGHGSICYGDHRAEIYADTNGRNAAIACAFALLDQEPYTRAAEHLAMMVAESYYGHELGHTGGGFNVIWRGIALPLLPEHAQAQRVRHMEQLAWYYDLCRQPGGQFSMLPSAPSGETRYTGTDWGVGVALTYTAPRRTLRITGRPPTQHSVQTPAVSPLPWGDARDIDFFGTHHAEGLGEEDQPPHVVYANLTGREPLTADDCARYLRHYNPVIRTFAGRKLAQLNNEDAYAAIESALRHPDVRVRRAACDAISGYDNWGRGSSGAGMPREIVSQRFVPHIERMLADPDAAYWEIDGALWALGAAQPEEIRRNRRTINRFAEHDEWYLRESAYWALVGLGSEMTGEEFLFLAEMYADSRHVFERSSYDAGINYLLRRARLRPDDQTIAAYVRRLGPTAREIAVAFGYDEMAARHEAVHRTMMVLDRFEDPPYALIVPDFVAYLEDWRPGYQHSNWLVTGSNWQPGLIEIAQGLGAEGRPIIAALKAREQAVEWDMQSRDQPAVREAILEAVRVFEAEHGAL